MLNHRDVECMTHALRLARRGRFTTRPNPNVGCVITNAEGEVVGTGYHRRAGEAHAEIIALQDAGTRARGATVYVTLEPCCHQGKTGPCTEALIEAGVSRVVIATEDPNPLVTGKGMQRLREHGINVDVDVLSDQARALNIGFFKRMESGYPWVKVKSAISLDGRTALHNGESKWITSSSARSDVQVLRAHSDVVLTGIGTVLADDPALNVRVSAQELGSDEELIQPTRVVIDSALQMPTDAKMLHLAGHTIVFTHNESAAKKFPKSDHCEVVCLSSKLERINLREVLEYLAAQEVNTILVEAGANLVGSLMQHNLVDELVIYMAPKLFGDTAQGMTSLEPIATMDERVSLEYTDIRHVGNDLRITALVKH